MCLVSQGLVSDVLAPADAFYPPEGPGVETIEPGCEGVVQRPGFRAVQEDGDD